jgi:beta-lactamase regulating signal transducer with metallopeptidase domain
MTALFDSVGPALWRASWQAAVLAIVVFLLLQLCGERMTPAWRYRLWCVVILRLLLVIAPSSPWSVFNLVARRPERAERQIAEHVSDSPIVDPRAAPRVLPDISSDSLPKTDPAELPIAAQQPSATQTSALHEPAMEPPRSSLLPWSAITNVRNLEWIWLTGCLVLGLRLLQSSFALRRRLAACRRVDDRHVLSLLNATQAKFRLRRSPILLVTPESVSPYIVGAFSPKIIVPESIAMEASPARLRHVLAHEMAHLVRGDLWANWLFLLARIVHWFNPAAWWAFRELQAAREQACDELALAALGDSNRSEYAATIVELAANLLPSSAAPATIGLFSSRDHLKNRIHRLARPTSIITFRTPIAASLLLAIVVLGLTDARSVASADQNAESASQSPAAADATKPVQPAKSDYTIHGKCIDWLDQSPVGGVHLRLFMSVGLAAAPVEIGNTVSDADGKFEFTGLTPPRRDQRIDRLMYTVIAEANDRPTTIDSDYPVPGRDKNLREVRMNREQATLSGKVTNEQGQPLAGATVMQYSENAHPLPGILSATTDADGKFTIERLRAWHDAGAIGGINFRVVHPDYPPTIVLVKALPGTANIALAKGCVLTGKVVDRVTGQPGAGATVIAEPVDNVERVVAACDAAGQFRLVVPERRFNIWVEAENRVSTALTDRECLAGETLELPPFNLVNGGFISGRVINTKSGQPVTAADDGQPITIGLYGPSQPLGRVISPTPAATVDGSGRFTIRAAPGDNFPYFVNTRGDRMAWDTREKPAVVVKEGETTNYDMLITPEVSPAEKLKGARELVAALPKDPHERTARILAEFRKLSKTVDECELWCSLMQDLVAIGPEAVPQICEELDHTTADRSIRRLAFALRAIGDPRAVPALIRAIPNTLLPSSSDYGLLVNDFGLTEFMQKHDLSAGSNHRMGGGYFDVGRPPREVFAALHKLTKQAFDDDEVGGISLSDDPRRQVLQRRLYLRNAQRWQTWWDANWKTLTQDAAYQTVGLRVVEESLPAATKTLGPTARLGDGVQGETLSPAVQTGKYATHFLDLDTGYSPKWPTEFPRDEAQLDQKQLAAWAAKNGVDLMCATHVAANGTQTFVLKALGMQVWEISERDQRNLDRLIAAGTLPQGRAVKELLMHYDTESKQSVPEANAAFIYITHEGSMGVIETTDRVTRTADLTGQFSGAAPSGVGFFKGVKFNIKPIVP